MQLQQNAARQRSAIATESVAAQAQQGISMPPSLSQQSSGGEEQSRYQFRQPAPPTPPPSPALGR